MDTKEMLRAFEGWEKENVTTFLFSDKYTVALEAWEAGAAFGSMKTAAPWQPIETAPRDGTAILLGAKGGSWIGKYLPVFQSGFVPDNPWSSLMLNHDHMGEKWQRPTHWRPLDAPPSQINQGDR